VKNKWRCPDCHWIGPTDDFLEGKNPFDETDTILGCPACKAIVNFDQVCDEDGCDALTSCGFPTPDGYRNTCYRHSDFYMRFSGKKKEAGE